MSDAIRRNKQRKMTWHKWHYWHYEAGKCQKCQKCQSNFLDKTTKQNYINRAGGQKRRQMDIDILDYRYFQSKKTKNDSKKLFSFEIPDEDLQELKLLSKLYTNQKLDKEYDIQKY